MYVVLFVGITIEVISSNGTQLWPVQKVMKRITLGKEDALYPYILGAVNDYMKTPDGVTTQVGTGKKPWWKLW
ncbi:MAG: hypothetical protein AVDCRST_MAG56-1692 [uncultured Cytophagales bacterium]|uniref:Uncharacterized protein n=1 Tax=uncultured Cytophagales bacterium TaxID=158755 RepID=A0A6J4IB42_9SPHI|nr:MAG: hypothetical protein AVDCRST_MAG56-1692 [uncultured Cytophagales bacterium]